MRFAVVAALLILCPGSLVGADPDDPLAPVAFLVGDHRGEGKHPYGTYQETQNGAYALAKTVIEVRTRSVMQGRTVHEDLRVVSWDGHAKRLRMRQWTSKVLRIYAGTVDGQGRVVFEETAREGTSGERWRYTFVPKPGAGFTYTVHVDSGKGWRPFVAGDLGEEVKDPSKGGGLALRQYDADVDGMYAQVHYPDGEGPFPALVFSPGGRAASFAGYRPYGRWYATWGFITVIVAFDDESVTERAAKFSKVIDWLGAENGRDGAPLEGLIDVKRLAVGGHSRGGAAAIRAARFDARAAACLAFAPSGPSEQIEGEHACPLLVIIGDRDEFVDAATRAAKNAPGPAYLFVVAGMSHMLEPREATLKLVARSTSFLQYALRGDARYESFLTREEPGIERIAIDR
jgi:dienelactone hydrolase